jgi:hypothetical protein
MIIPLIEERQDNKCGNACASGFAEGASFVTLSFSTQQIT